MQPLAPCAVGFKSACIYIVVFSLKHLYLFKQVSIDRLKVSKPLSAELSIHIKPLYFQLDLFL